MHQHRVVHIEQHQLHTEHVEQYVPEILLYMAHQHILLHHTDHRVTSSESTNVTKAEKHSLQKEMIMMTDETRNINNTGFDSKLAKHLIRIQNSLNSNF